MSLAIEKLIDAQIILPDSITLSEDAAGIREALLDASNFLTISNADEAKGIGESARNIRTHVKAVRDMGMSLRRPLKAAQDQIKAIEDDYCKTLEERQGRLEKLVTAYAQAEARRVAEEERKREEEVRRIQNERIAAELKAKQELERIEREAREAEAKAKANAQTLSSSELFRAGIAEDKRKQEAEDARAAAEGEIERVRLEGLAKLTVAVAAPPIEPTKIVGMASKQTVHWNVEDEAKLLATRRELFKIEVRPSAINSTCFPASKEFTKEKPDRTSVPGLALWWEWETNTRKW